MTKKKLLLGLAMGVGLLAYSAVLVTGTKTAYKKDLRMQEDKVAQVIEEMAADASVSESESNFGTWFTKMDSDNQTKVIDACIYYATKRSQDISFSEEEIKLLENAKEGAGINNEKITDEELKKRIDELKIDHLTVRHVNESWFADVDYNYYLTQYADELTPGYSNLLEFYCEEKSDDYFYPSTGNLNLPVVEARLDKLYDMSQNPNNEDVYMFIDTAEKFYLAMYLGSYDESYILKDGAIKDEVLASYKAYDAKNPYVKQLLSEVVSLYESNDKMRTIEISNKVNEFLGYTEEAE